ncbi:cupin domain-containing protein [Ancylobacter defluvii]|uniref:Cupin n=1 Tax=Ancylobacter defluvii TaxID=1282440 RepID=A0A9W6JYQ2_9HYPH|nr:cupin domain-containing protein [Ancylobacter defluvii]MBS7589167.1 cupin domain-containing protein [Ancylobacter defluvii]GLK84779.1 cupin [Ancylobacter defluvii]
MSEAAILRPSALPVTERGGGARTVRLVTAELGSQKLLNGITRFGPGAAIPLHSHNCEESVIILEGDAVFEIDGVAHELTQYDTTWIPPNVPHRFRNTSQTAPLAIFWTYADTAATRTMAATGETHSIASEHANDRHTNDRRAGQAPTREKPAGDRP